MSIAGALANSRRQGAVHPARVAVAVCPPTRVWRIQADRLLPDPLLLAFGWRSDFLRTMATGRFLTLAEYWSNVGGPVLRTLEAMADTGCTVVRDASFRRFAALLQSDAFDVLFLVAHHVTGDGVDAPEFADGVRPFADVHAAVHDRVAPLVMFLCRSGEWRDALVARSARRMAAGGTPFLMPFPESMTFLLFCLRQFDGRRTLDEAIDRATRAFLARPDRMESL